MTDDEKVIRDTRLALLKEFNNYARKASIIADLLLALDEIKDDDDEN